MDVDRQQAANTLRDGRLGNHATFPVFRGGPGAVQLDLHGSQRRLHAVGQKRGREKSLRDPKRLGRPQRTTSLLEAPVAATGKQLFRRLRTPKNPSRRANNACPLVSAQRLPSNPPPTLHGGSRDISRMPSTRSALFGHLNRVASLLPPDSHTAAVACAVPGPLWSGGIDSLVPDSEQSARPNAQPLHQ